MTIPLWVLYAALALGATLIALAWALMILSAWREWRWRRRKGRMRGDLLEALERKVGGT